VSRGGEGALPGPPADRRLLPDLCLLRRSLFGIGVSFLAGFSFFPLLERIAHLGPMQPVLHFGFNLLVIVVLLWSHYHLAPATCLFRAATCRTERKLIHPHQTVPMSRDTGGLVARRHGQVARATIGLNCMAKS